MPIKTLADVRTQKARGILVLKQEGTSFNFSLPYTRVVDTIDDLYGLGKSFVRPCPVIPRHGFVESRICSTFAEIQRVLEEAKAADEFAELIIMPVIDATDSAIWTPGQLTIGPGNSGATSGINTSILPVTGTLVTPKLCEMAWVKNSPYLEFVYGNQEDGLGIEPWLVQLRDGPSLPIGVKDFIPGTMTVTNVYTIPEPENERPTLLEWEKIVEQFIPGTAVYHPSGGLADHYSIHCISQYKFHSKPIALLTTRCPTIGETLEQVSEPSPFPDTEEMRRGFKLAVQSKIKELPSNHPYRDVVMAMLAGVHNAGVWMGHHDRLIGYGMGMAYRLTHTACMGELRHGREICRVEVGTEIDATKESRDKIYKRFFNRTFVTKQKLQAAIRLFYDMDNGWGPNFGGPKWAELAWSGLRLYNFVAENKYSQAMTTYNELINMVHNGGWAFNKFCGKGELDRAAEAGAYPVLKALPLFHSLLKNKHRFKLTDWDTVPEPMKVENKVRRVPIVVQARVDKDKKVIVQVKWNIGPFTPAHPIEVSKLAMTMIRREINAGSLNMVVSLSSGYNQFLKLTPDENWVWYVESKGIKEPVTVVEPEQHISSSEIIFPDMPNFTVVLKADPVSIPISEPTPKPKANSSEPSSFSDKATELSIEVGDTVQCTDPSHTGNNPFVVGFLGEPLYDGEKLAYFDGAQDHEHSSGYTGCYLSKLKLVSKKGKA